MSRGEGTRTGVQFLSDLIPEFDRVIIDAAATQQASGAPGKVSEPGAPQPSAS